MTKHPVTTRDQWVAERRQLLAREQELNRLRGEVAKDRRSLPWEPIEKEYTFATEEGTKTLAELFDGRSHLLVYHMMFGPEWTAACPGCTNLVDDIDAALVPLNHYDITAVAVAHAPIEKVQAYRRRMGWSIPCVSSYGSDFNHDFGVSFTEEQRREGAEYNFAPVDFDKVVEELGKSEMIVRSAESCGTDVADYVSSEGPGLSSFVLDDGVVYRTYSGYAPDGMFNLRWSEFLDVTPVGDEPVTEIRRRDEY
jgi:predicted dithiol-disulfide oxidoreductase (DUF899 family)